jgi:Domain of unknown function (DUF4265)
MHVLLRLGERDGTPDYEPVHVEPIAGNCYRVLFSPGLAYGVAAGDEIQLDENGRYEVAARAGNLAVRLLCASGVANIEETLTDQVERIGGRLDGQVRAGLAYTIPLTAGRDTIAELFTKAKQENDGALWEYGNVYDENGQLLEWLRGEA